MPRITVEGLSHEGRGVARVGGKVGFIDGALPGETVDAALLRHHRRYDEYRLIEVIAASPDRVRPVCPLVGTCGGCDLQHVDADAQLRHKMQVVLELLARQSGLVPEQLAEPLVSEPFGYRRRARLALRVPRRGGRPVLGFREAGGSRVVALTRCPVLAPPLADLPAALAERVATLQRPRDIGHIELSVSESPDGAQHPVVHVHLVEPLAEPDRRVLGELATDLSAYASLQAPGQPLEYLYQPDPWPPGYLLPKLGLRISYQPGDFLQGNRVVNRALVGQVVDWVVERLCDVPGQRILDAFCGVGNFSLALGRRGVPVLGVDVVPEMVARARQNAEANSVEGVTFAARDLMDEPVDLKRDDFAAAVLDPPRAGARGLVAALTERGTGTIVYVSCAPATLARDAAVLASRGYRLARLGLVDMFPQTSHIESIGLFVRQ